ncbi:MAG: glycoside hydrolase family 13 protein [Actinobacteria bacterium]|nr:glycoside hydrolase family 13 protein [Actinomycetota bacterium]
MTSETTDTAADPTTGTGPATAPAPVPAATRTDDPWWRSAVTYQLYIRSFADGNGDGLGDVAGIRQRLPYLAALGVDAIWVNPWYPSPQADGGYDVSDYRDIEPAFGTLDEAQAMIDEAHALGLKVILDIVPNHTSDEHAWFAAALAAGPGSPERARYLFRPGKGPDGALPPNDWKAVFGGPAWERVTEPDGTPGEWYLHLFDPKQPDLDWENPEVRSEFLDILRFWFDRGADGFRIDVAHGLVKDPAMPDLGDDEEHLLGTPDRADHPHWDLPGVHDIYREWRVLADSYDPPKLFVAEAWVSSPERLAAYLRPDELHTAFDFDFVRAAWDAAELRATATSSLAAHDRVGAPVMWTLSNHDITRHVSRLGRPQSERSADPLHGANGETDVALGRRRARAALLLELALPGGVYLYQGEELGLEEVEDLPEELLQDPTWERSGHVERGRDGCRVPLPWAPDGPSLGFGDAAPWLPQPASWSAVSAASHEGDPTSMLALYREALRLRRDLPALGAGTGADVTWLDLGDDVVAFRREPGVVCLVNCGSTPVPLPAGTVLLASVPLDLSASPALPADTAVWLAV